MPLGLRELCKARAWCRPNRSRQPIRSTEPPHRNRPHIQSRTERLTQLEIDEVAVLISGGLISFGRFGSIPFDSKAMARQNQNRISQNHDAARQRTDNRPTPAADCCSASLKLQTLPANDQFTRGSSLTRCLIQFDQAGWVMCNTQIKQSAISICHSHWCEILMSVEPVIV
jgi:hypothetical protein